jgi:hypothetical protein
MKRLVIDVKMRVGLLASLMVLVVEVDPIVWTKYCLSLDGEAG